MARSRRNLDGKVVAITGAARGIGRATAAALAAAGMRVAIGDVDGAAAEDTAREIGSGTIALTVDVTDRASVAEFLDDVESQLGPLDVLVNNAGIMPLGRLVDEPDEVTDRMIDVNVHGVLHGMKEGLPRLIARRSGHLVNVASSAGKVGYAGAATYSGTKHFVVGVSEAVRAELKGTGVEVSCVMPGVVNTELSSGLPRARGVQVIEPDDVAAAILTALREPRFDVFVPRAIGPIGAVMGLMPRSARERFARLIEADTLLDTADPEGRRAYEERVGA